MLKLRSTAFGIFTEIIESVTPHHERQSGSTRRSSGTGQAGTVKLHSAFLRRLIRSALCVSYFCLIKRPSIAIVASSSENSKQEAGISNFKWHDIVSYLEIKKNAGNVKTHS